MIHFGTAAPSVNTSTFQPMLIAASVNCSRRRPPGRRAGSLASVDVDDDGFVTAIFTNGLAKQVAKQGIRVNAVAPGPIWTPLQVAGGQLPGKMGEFGQDTPLGRAGQPAELAPLYVALASGELSYTDGSVWGANGGTGAV